MNFNALIDFLEKRLQLPMPGHVAHDLMKPKLANGAPIQIKHSRLPRDSAVMILLYQRNGKIHFPLIQRPKYEGVHSGQIALPGGSMEGNDRDLFETALRETKEEIGVEKNKVEIIGNLSSFYVMASNFNVLPVIGYVNYIPNFVPDSREVEEIIYPSIVDLIDVKNRKEKKVTAKGGIKLLSPYFDLSGRTVWGATAMMLSELVVILEEFSGQ
ncbi:MAG: CoA pyrophosphatase [Bacteroidota bacterium]